MSDHRSTWAGVVASAFALAIPASAQASDMILGAGVSESLVLPDATHYAVYGYAGGTLSFALDDAWYLAPSLYLEVAPEVGRGGGLATLTLSRSLGGWGTGDVIASLAHDQHHLDFGGALFSVGLGAGVSIVVDSLVVSPSMSVFRVVDDPSWTLTPALTLGYLL
jgi:hypothetical protein